MVRVPMVMYNLISMYQRVVLGMIIVLCVGLNRIRPLFLYFNIDQSDDISAVFSLKVMHTRSFLTNTEVDSGLSVEAVLKAKCFVS